jgi:hypothetical protein
MENVDKPKRKQLSILFQGYRWNYLPAAILDGKVGEATADNAENPQVAVLALPKIKLFIPGGDASQLAAQEFMAQLPRVAMLIFASDGWEELLKATHPGRFIRTPRFAFTSERLDTTHLQKLASRIPDGYRLEQMDLNMAKQLAAEKSDFASDHMGNFDSPEDFIARGFGFCVLAGDEIVSAATTFVICEKGIEIQINTREQHRRKGLATNVAARLMLHSLQNGLDPNWDAENTKSARLAEKLGYSPQGLYPLWVVVDSRWKSVTLKLALKIKSIIEN